MYVNHHADHVVQCVAIAVRELCDMGNSDDTNTNTNNYNLDK